MEDNAKIRVEVGSTCHTSDGVQILVDVKSIM
jgi:hypothetical protein